MPADRPLPPTRDKVLAYVATLSPAVQAIYRAADDIMLCEEDTGSEEFQFAALVLEMVNERTKQWLEIHCD